MKTSVLQILLIFFTVNLSGYQISGRLTDAKSGLVIEYATIYINGTSIGTISDTAGFFRLEYAFRTCQLVASHTSYQSKMISLELSSNIDLNIQLFPRTIHIQQVSVEAKNRRDINMEYFKKKFLGDDFWGENANIKNDSVISFITEYSDKDLLNNDLDGQFKHFEVLTSARLIIDLNKLGYQLEYDLVRFIEQYNNDLNKKTISMLGYSYYRPIELESKQQARKINKNRLKAYYNSPMHFLRSLYENTLAENGYLLYQVNRVDSINIIFRRLFRFENCNCLSYQGDEVCLSGFNGEKFFIEYYHYKNHPLNIKQRDLHMVSVNYSELFILDDSCIIRKEGTLPGGQMVFNNDLAVKRIGASLPSNFYIKP